MQTHTHTCTGHDSPTNVYKCVCALTVITPATVSTGKKKKRKTVRIGTARDQTEDTPHDTHTPTHTADANPPPQPHDTAPTPVPTAPPPSVSVEEGGNDAFDGLEPVAHTLTDEDTRTPEGGPTHAHVVEVVREMDEAEAVVDTHDATAQDNQEEGKAESGGEVEEQRGGGMTSTPPHKDDVSTQLSDTNESMSAPVVKTSMATKAKSWIFGKKTKDDASPTTLTDVPDATSTSASTQRDTAPRGDAPTQRSSASPKGSGGEASSDRSVAVGSPQSPSATLTQMVESFRSKAAKACFQLQELHRTETALQSKRVDLEKEQVGLHNEVKTLEQKQLVSVSNLGRH